ncbi:MAG: hypothetical protein JST85_15665 [Acidobacteria bacterium]|nr:hypothetical protein [Acidobacteriota bacterium]
MLAVVIDFSFFRFRASSQKGLCYDPRVMISQALPQLSAFEAQAAANGFLLDHLPDRYLAIEPRLDNAVQGWRVKVVLTYPFIGPVGEVGEILVSAYSEKILSHTPLSEMRERGRQVYEQNREAIQTAFSQAGN